MRSPFRQGRHSAASPKNTARGLLVTAGIFAIAIGMAGTVTGTTYALWNSTVSLSGATVASGTIGLTVNNAADLAVTGMDTTKLTPGRSVVVATPLTIRNTGSTRLLTTLVGTTFVAPAGLTAADMTSNVLISFRSTTATTCTVTSDSVALPASISPITMAVGGTATLCLEVRLSASAPASFEGKPLTFTINLRGDQLRPTP